MLGSDELAERGTTEFYREQVERLVTLADSLKDSAARLELLEIAAVFQRLAERGHAARSKLRNNAARKSA